MTDKLIVVINSLKLPKIEKILLYEMKFLVRNYSWLQNPCLGCYRPQIPVLSALCPQLNLFTPPNKIPGYATDVDGICSTFKKFLRVMYSVCCTLTQPYCCIFVSKENIKPSATESVGLHELRQHKPWFVEECLGFLDQRKQAKM